MIIAERAGKFVLHWDERRGSTLVVLKGFWDGEDLDAFYAHIGPTLERSRARHGHALLLVDTSEGQVMSGALFERIDSTGFSLVNAGDRVATIVASTLVKMQLMRANAPQPVQHEFFVSHDAADAWLHAHIAAGRTVS